MRKDTKYKMLAVDLDGTLLTDNKEILEKTVEKIRKMIDLGFIFTFATGRSKKGVMELVKKIGINIPLCLYNGSLVTFAFDDRVLTDKKLEKEEAIKIFNIIDRMDKECLIYSNEIFYVNKLGKYSIEYEKKYKNKVTAIDYHDLDLNNIVKIIWFDESDKLIEYQNTFLKDEIKNSNFYTSTKTFLEFVNKDASKTNGIREICKYYNISLDEVITMGDGLNDFDMIKNSGFGVMMINGDIKLKEVAKDITTRTNNEDGVGEIIDKYFLNQVIEE